VFAPKAPRALPALVIAPAPIALAAPEELPAIAKGLTETAEAAAGPEAEAAAAIAAAAGGAEAEGETETAEAACAYAAA
jgi:hypothetical protein